MAITAGNVAAPNHSHHKLLVCDDNIHIIIATVSSNTIPTVTNVMTTVTINVVVVMQPVVTLTLYIIKRVCRVRMVCGSSLMKNSTNSIHIPEESIILYL